MGGSLKITFIVPLTNHFLNSTSDWSVPSQFVPISLSYFVFFVARATSLSLDSSAGSRTIPERAF